MLDLNLVFLVIIVVLFGAFLLWLFFLRPHFGGITIPDKDTIYDYISNMSDEEKESISHIKQQLNFTGSLEIFTLLCVFTALSIKKPLIALTYIVLRLYFDSLDYIEYILMLEELLEISISDEDAAEMKTFGDILKYVEAEVSSVTGSAYTAKVIATK